MNKQITKELIEKAFPWGVGFRKIVQQSQPCPFGGSHTMIGSDYSGSGQTSNYYVYSFLLVDADASPIWPKLRNDFRKTYLPDGRRMSFKNLNDNKRQVALIPFLNIAEAFYGLCCVIVVHKSITYISSTPKTLDILNNSLGTLNGKWNAKSFEIMARTVHFCCLLISLVCMPNQHITWITDHDEIVANDSRLTDVINFLAKITSLYVDYPLGEFAMNTTEIDTHDRSFEDFVAVPDLIAGAFAEIVTKWSKQPDWHEDKDIFMMPKTLSFKSNLISSWFCQKAQTLRRCAVIIEPEENGQIAVKSFDYVR